jgi:hypothetical protein
VQHRLRWVLRQRQPARRLLPRLSSTLVLPLTSGPGLFRKPSRPRPIQALPPPLANVRRDRAPGGGPEATRARGATGGASTAPVPSRASLRRISPRARARGSHPPRAWQPHVPFRARRPRSRSPPEHRRLGASLSPSALQPFSPASASALASASRRLPRSPARRGCGRPASPHTGPSPQRGRAPRRRRRRRGTSRRRSRR